MNWVQKLSFTSFLWLCVNQSFAQKPAVPAAKEDFLTIQGIVVDDESRLEGVIVRLYKGNSKIDSIYTGKNGAFQFILGKDYYYSIEFQRIGYENTCVIINSNRFDVDPQNEENGYQVDFEVELIPEIPNKNTLALSAEDFDALDFPKVIIGYKSGDDEGFVSDKKYLKEAKEAIKKIKATAKGK